MFEYHGNGIRRFSRLTGNRRVNAQVEINLGGGVIPILKQGFTFCFGQHKQVFDKTISGGNLRRNQFKPRNQTRRMVLVDPVTVVAQTHTAFAQHEIQRNPINRTRIRVGDYSHIRCGDCGDTLVACHDIEREGVLARHQVLLGGKARDDVGQLVIDRESQRQRHPGRKVACGMAHTVLTIGEMRWGFDARAFGPKPNCCDQIGSAHALWGCNVLADPVGLFVGRRDQRQTCSDHALQAIPPERIMFRDSLDCFVQPFGFLQNRKRLARGNDGLQRHSAAVLIGDFAQVNRTALNRNGNGVGSHIQHLAGYALAICAFCGSDQQNATACGNLRAAQRVIIGPVVQSTDKADDLGRGFPKIETTCRLGAMGQAEIAALGQILFATRLALGLKRGHNIRETVNCGAKAFCVQGQRGVTLANRETALHEDITFVHTIFDQVPRDTMFRFAIGARPNRRIQACVARQRPIVKVHGPFARAP